MTVAAKWQRYRRRCAQCGAMFGCFRKVQRFCSQTCFAQSRVEALRIAGRAGGLARGVQRHQVVVSELRAAWPDMPDAAVAVLQEERRKWWEGGYRSGVVAGRRQGFAEALGEREVAS